MPKPFNLYLATRAKNLMAIQTYINHSAGETINTKDYEVQALKTFVDEIFLIDSTVSLDVFSSFYYSYTIPQLSKEFDLLKTDGRQCINIELKSKPIAIEKIKRQLLSNRYYLNGIATELYQFTVVTEPFIVYRLVDDEIKEESIEILLDCLKELHNLEIEKDIDSLFNPSKYLVSPLNTPDRFLSGQYFLTESQESFKQEIIKRLSDNQLLIHGITGSPGTGKTLLLYDIAITVSEEKKVLLIHCGKLSAAGHFIINKTVDNIEIISAKDIKEKVLDNYDVVFIDEIQRLFLNQFSYIVEECQKRKKTIICAYDPIQVLSVKEKNANISSKLESINGFKKYKLKDKIRTNKEIADFITSIVDLNKKQTITTQNAEILYASNEEVAKTIIDYYKEKDYEFINMTPSSHFHSIYNDLECETHKNSHRVVGQEFDNVLVLLDNYFLYEKGKLGSIAHPNPNYLFNKLFYQNITRARIKLTVLVLENEQLYTEMITVFR